MSRVFYPQCRAILQVVFDGFGEEAQDSDPKIIPIFPKEARITRNSYRQADSWELTFEANDMPIDPRLIRAGAVEIFLFQVAGIPGQDQRILNRSSAFEDRANRQPRDPIDQIMLEVESAALTDKFTFGNKPIVTGLFDSAQLEMSGGGKWVTIAGQDYTDFLIQKQWPPLPNGRARRIPVGRKLDVLLREILADADEEGRLELVVENIPTNEIPVVGKKEVRCHKRGIPVKQETSFWDVMYKLATRHGFILFVRNLQVVLTTPQNLTEEFEHRIKRLAWGNNLTSLELSRDMGKETAPVIVMKSYDPETKKTLFVDYPPGLFQKIKRRSRKAKGGKKSASIKKTEEYRIIPMHGITDPAVLRRLAETRYTLIGKAERKVRFETKDLSDFNGKDMLSLTGGDAVTVGFADFNFELLSNPDVSEQEKFTHLTRRGYGQAIARVIAQSYQKLQFLERPLRVREATYDFSVSDGISIEAELVDFIMVDGIRDKDAKVSRKKKRSRKYQNRQGQPTGQKVIFSDADGDVITGDGK